MFCPSCNAFVTESSLIKLNLKQSGSSPVEYDARCPVCLIDIGHVFWGVFTPFPHLRAASLRAQEEASASRCCPHCGKTLPADLNSLPLAKTSQKKPRQAEEEEAPYLELDPPPPQKPKPTKPKPEPEPDLEMDVRPSQGPELEEWYRP